MTFLDLLSASLRRAAGTGIREVLGEVEAQVQQSAPGPGLQQALAFTDQANLGQYADAGAQAELVAQALARKAAALAVGTGS